MSEPLDPNVTVHYEPAQIGEVERLRTELSALTRERNALLEQLSAAATTAMRDGTDIQRTREALAEATQAVLRATSLLQTIEGQRDSFKELLHIEQRNTVLAKTALAMIRDASEPARVVGASAAALIMVGGLVHGMALRALRGEDVTKPTPPAPPIGPHTDGQPHAGPHWLGED